jgi:hypothetical protein
MAEEVKNEVIPQDVEPVENGDLEVLETNEMPVIPQQERTDIILNVEGLAAKLEKRAKEFTKIREIAIKFTLNNDWVQYGMDNPIIYLTSVGAERLRSLLGISVTNINYKKEVLQDGHFVYTFFGEFSIGDTKFLAIGSASSKTPFFSRSRGTIIPPTEINEVNVMKAGYSNLLVNGITRLLGLRNIPLEELKKYGKIPRVITFGHQYTSSQASIQNQSSTTFFAPQQTEKRTRKQP